MPLKSTIISFSDVYKDENFVEMVRDHDFLDLSGLSGANCFCDSEAARSIEKELAKISYSEGEIPLRWIDSGDYHYMTSLNCRNLVEPFTLVVFDNHSDMQEPEFADLLSCGGWVLEMMRNNKSLRRVISIGPEGKFRILDPLSGPLAESPLKPVDKLMMGIDRRLLSDYSSDLIYISIDKDVMCRNDARTNWSQGQMTLLQMEMLLEIVISSSKAILGIDVCGELSSGKGGTPEDMSVNLRTNLELLHFLQSRLQ